MVSLNSLFNSLCTVYCTLSRNISAHFNSRKKGRSRCRFDFINRRKYYKWATRVPFSQSFWLNCRRDWMQNSISSYILSLISVEKLQKTRGFHFLHSHSIWVFVTEEDIWHLCRLHFSIDFLYLPASMIVSLFLRWIMDVWQCSHLISFLASSFDHKLCPQSCYCCVVVQFSIRAFSSNRQFNDDLILWK